MTVTKQTNKEKRTSHTKHRIYTWSATERERGETIYCHTDQ